MSVDDDEASTGGFVHHGMHVEANPDSDADIDNNQDYNGIEIIDNHDSIDSAEFVDADFPTDKIEVVDEVIKNSALENQVDEHGNQEKTKKVFSLLCGLEEWEDRMILYGIFQKLPIISILELKKIAKEINRNILTEQMINKLSNDAFFKKCYFSHNIEEKELNKESMFEQIERWHIDYQN